jgi:hypothetical protein
MIKNLLIALAVTFVAGVVIMYVGATSSLAMAVVLGVAVFFALHMTSRNRKEVRVDDAHRLSSLRAVAPAGQALLYIYREGFVGKLVGWNVSLDGTSLAQLRSPRFTQTTLGPGSHTLAVSLDGPAANQNKPAEETFVAQPGDVIVFAMKSKMGALSNTLSFVRELDTPSALRKLSKIPMVAEQRAGGTTDA